MKKAFTMIELIFVIVILGILAAVALPKFLGVANQAHEGNLKSFVGTLNRSAGPSIWSKAIAADGSGSVSALTGTDQSLSTYVDIPKEINETDANLTADCNDSNNYTVILTAPAKVAGNDYVVACKDGTSSQSLAFRLYKTSGTVGTTKFSESNTTNCIAGPGCK